MSKPMNLQSKYVDIIAKIGECFEKMRSMRPLPKEGVAYFYNEFAISSTHSSNAIEGNTFTYDETRLLLEKGITASARSFREHEDIVGYKQAFDFLLAAIKERLPITEEFIKQLHSYVLKGQEGAGEYRTIQNFVGDILHVVYTPCKPSEVQEKMREFLDILSKDTAENIRLIQADKPDFGKVFLSLAMHHILFERIHPFVDGNGRTGRLLLTYELILLGLLPVDIRYEERKRYYAALACYDDKSKYSTREDSKAEKLAKLLAESELTSMQLWLKIFADYLG